MENAALRLSRLSTRQRRSRIQYCCARNIRLIIVREEHIPMEWMIAFASSCAGGLYYLIISTVNYGSLRFVLAAHPRRIRGRALVLNARDFHYHFRDGFGSHNEPLNMRKTSFLSSSTRDWHARVQFYPNSLARYHGERALVSGQLIRNTREDISLSE